MSIVEWFILDSNLGCPNNLMTFMTDEVKIIL